MKTQTYSIRLRERGQVTIPRVIREKMSAKKGDVLTLVQIDDLILLTARQPQVPALVEQFTAAMDEAAIPLADLLAGLTEERKASSQKRRDQDA